MGTRTVFDCDLCRKKNIDELYLEIEINNVYLDISRGGNSNSLILCDSCSTILLQALDIADKKIKAKLLKKPDEKVSALPAKWPKDWLTTKEIIEWLDEMEKDKNYCDFGEDSVVLIEEVIMRRKDEGSWEE